MKDLFSILIRTAFTFVAFAAIQFLIPYYFIVLGGLAAGFFMLKTGDDRATSIGVLVGTILFAIFAFVNAQIYPITG